ncbi:MAG: ATP-grasp domain-containing protein [Methylomicrobium sp.]|nr:ATP-grasp domain-containing protein [Methylomicrobium sp.]
MKKRIMILGAGIYQIPLIKKAKEMGLETIVVTPKGPYPGIQMADIVLDKDTTDAESIILAAKEYDIAGIVTAGTDVSVPTVGAVVDALKLKGPTKQVAVTVSSKSRFRSFLQKNRLNHPEFVRCEDIEDAWTFYRNINSKIVMKPDDSSGSRGVSVIEQGQPEKVVQEAYDNAIKFSRSKVVCAEAFIDGVEVGGDAFVLNGEIIFITTTCKYFDGVVVQGHSLPSSLSDEAIPLVKDEIQRAAFQLNYLDGPINFDVMIGESKVTIIEMGLRNGGNGIVDLVYHSYGVDLMKWLLAYVLSQPIDKTKIKEPKSISSYVFGSENKGILIKISNLQELRTQVPEVLDMVLAKQPGDSVEAFIHNANLIGYLLLNCGESGYQQIVTRIREVLKIEVRE